jgi:hypothetical protein
MVTCHSNARFSGKVTVAECRIAFAVCCPERSGIAYFDGVMLDPGQDVPEILFRAKPSPLANLRWCRSSCRSAPRGSRRQSRRCPQGVPALPGAPPPVFAVPSVPAAPVAPPPDDTG